MVRGNKDPGTACSPVRRSARGQMVASPDGRCLQAAHDRAEAGRTAGRCRAGVVLSGKVGGHDSDAASRQPPASCRAVAVRPPLPGQPGRPAGRRRRRMRQDWDASHHDRDQDGGCAGPERRRAGSGCSRSPRVNTANRRDFSSDRYTKIRTTAAARRGCVAHAQRQRGHALCGDGRAQWPELG